MNSNTSIITKEQLYNYVSLIYLIAAVNENGKPVKKKEEWLLLASKLLDTIFDEEVTVECTLHSDIKYLGFINVKGKSLSFDRMDVLCKIGSMADYVNVDNCNGKVEFEFGFTGMTE